MKVLLILMDGMRPDAIEEIPQVIEMKKKASYTMAARTVMPSVTLPCHMSLFHSVEPSRHGTTTNTYAPQVRPIKGLCEVLLENGKKSAFFYGWEQLKDITRPASLSFAYYIKGKDIGWDKSNDILTDEAIKYIKNYDVDFAFLYLGEVDEVGHKYGWLSDEYMDALKRSWENAEKIISTLDDDYTVMIMADHGGHDRIHGTECDEDMTIPFFAMGKDFEGGKELANVNIIDVAPTVLKLFGIEKDEDWEGESIL